MEKIKLRDKWPYLGVMGIVLLVLCVIYRNVDLSIPLNYQGGDEFGVFYIIKTIKETGWYLANPRVGGVTGGDLFDYVYSDSLSFLMIRVISLFVSNVYMIGNLFYFLNYFLIALSALYVCRKFTINDQISIVVSVLYAFSVFIQNRYTHMWLTPYFLLPLSCLVAVWICEGEVSDKQKQFWKSRQFCQTAFFSFISAFTGFYYAFFTCVVYAIAIVIRFLQIGIKKFKNEAYSFCFFFCVIAGICMNVMPNILYWARNGSNSNSELMIRNSGDAETYALKLIQLFLPRPDHRISLFQRITARYMQNYPLVNENWTASLGIIASIGMLIALIWVFGKSEGRKRTYSLLVIGLFLVGTIGGIGSIFSLFIHTPMRCYNRISLMIMFFSLICLALVLEEVRTKIKKSSFSLLLFLILIFGLYDQTVDYVPSANQVSDLENIRNFVQQMDAQLEEDTLVFELPYVNWPSGGSYRLFAGYLESDKLRWSFGAMQGRPEAEWQQSVAASDVDTMLNALYTSGYGAIYLDMPVYMQKIGNEEALNSLCNELTEKLNIQPVISGNGELYYWDMINYR